MAAQGVPTLDDLGMLDGQLTALAERAKTQLAGLLDADLLEFAGRFERFRNRLALIDHEIVEALEVNAVAERRCARSTHRLLADTVRISGYEAKRRCDAAKALRPRRTMTGETLGPERSILAAAQCQGQVSVEQASVIIGCLSRLDRLPDPVTTAEITGAERTLTEHARTFDPLELRRCADKIVECVNPDGVLADDRTQQALREFHLIPRTDGLYSLRGVLTGRVGAALQAVLTPLAVRRKPCRPEGAVAGRDDRDYPARLHDALDDAVALLLRSDALPTTGGVPATVLITVAEADLRQGRGFGSTPDGTLVPVRTLGAWADEAEVIGVRTTSRGEVLELGRQRRIASMNQTLALIARDQACTFPGCEHPPQWCERHHVLDWQRGGRTDIANVTLLCKYHHRRFSDHGWSCRMIEGLPHWIPPRWVDREQKPILNQRLRRRHRDTDDDRISDAPD